ncbi:MAG: N-acetylglucosamine-6-phosphate deacetylase [Angelakisella sp.]
MSSMTIINARAVVGGSIKPCNLKLADGKIKGIMPPSDTYGKTFDAKDHLVLPGFVDIHTHGAKGVDFNNADASSIEVVRNYFASQGVTTFLPTVRTDSEETMLRSVLSIVKAKNNLGCSQIYGIHMEGPFLAAAYCPEAQRPLLQQCSYPLFKRLQDASGGNIRLMTMSPELEGAAPLVRKLSMEGVRVSLGHTGASYDAAVAAIESGAMSCTHIFHRMSNMEGQNPSAMAAILESDLYSEVVCDGHQISPQLVPLLLKIKGKNRMIAVTDSIMTVGMEEGLYQTGSGDVVVRGGCAVTLRGSVNAGSMLTASQALRNLMEFGGLTLPQAVPMLTENPAKLLGIYHQKGSLDVGKDADFFIMDKNYNILTTFSQGEIIYSLR